MFYSINVNDRPSSAFQDDNLGMTTYTVLKLEKNLVQVNELNPGTAYLFRVQAFTGEGGAGGSSMEEQFETLPEGTVENHWQKVSLALFKE